MTQKDREKVIGHALDHVAYRWTKGLPIRHDRREWTAEERELYNASYNEAKPTFADYTPGRFKIPPMSVTLPANFPKTT
jgi:hypothetical protein